MQYLEVYQLFARHYPQLILEDKYFYSYEAICWFLESMSEAKEDLEGPQAKKVQKKIEKLLAIAEKRKDSLSFGPMFPEERTYFPIQTKPNQEMKNEMKVPREITDALANKGYEIDDYQKGYAHDAKNPKRIVKIGKLIGDHPELKKIFDQRLEGKLKDTNQLSIVFTYNPRDIALMSTGRGWTSCANLTLPVADAPAAVQLSRKIKYGGMVAYLINSRDKDIENPIARIAIRRFIDKNTGSFILVPEQTVYGASSKEFVEEVKELLKKSNDQTMKGMYGVFQDAEGGYSDTFLGSPKVMMTDVFDNLIEELLKLRKSKNVDWEKITNGLKALVKEHGKGGLEYLNDQQVYLDGIENPKLHDLLFELGYPMTDYRWETLIPHVESVKFLKYLLDKFPKFTMKKYLWHLFITLRDTRLSTSEQKRLEQIIDLLISRTTKPLAPSTYLGTTPARVRLFKIVQKKVKEHLNKRK